jgi:BirA family biotin operon repressor/biotin-[acetyl-CoA-carboxylase] ligase
MKARLARGEALPLGLVALDQTEGRGRLGRTWIAESGKCLNLSVSCPEWKGHPKPWLLGMAAGVAVAGVFHARVQWPNDVVIRRKKIGGILVEVFPDRFGKLTPVVGIGINLTQTSFPEEIAHRATSLLIEKGFAPTVLEAAEAILARLEAHRLVQAWSEIQPVWGLFDETPGKEYKLITGEPALGIGLGPEGELICSVSGETRTVVVAEAMFGPAGA